MSYNKVVTSGNIVEVYRYEGVPRGGGRKRATTQSTVGVSLLPDDRQAADESSKSQRVRSPQNTRRAILEFRRLVRSNLVGIDCPVLVTLTYREGHEDIGRARKDFNAFARRLKGTFGNGLRYICVLEFHKRGAIHLHAIVWGISEVFVKRERNTRLVASLWGFGFIDLIPTNGSQKLATYLSKYFGKLFADTRLAGRRAYIASRNVFRPVVDRDCVLLPYFHGGLVGVPDLSTAEVLRISQYQTQWLGRCDYKQFSLKTPYVASDNKGDVALGGQ